MRPSRRANAGNSIARRWRPWLWENEGQSGVEAAAPPSPPTPVRNELKMADWRDPDPE